MYVCRDSRTFHPCVLTFPIGCASPDSAYYLKAEYYFLFVRLVEENGKSVQFCHMSLLVCGFLFLNLIRNNG